MLVDLLRFLLLHRFVVATNGFGNLRLGHWEKVKYYGVESSVVRTSNRADVEAWRENVQIVLQRALQMIVNAGE